MILPYTPVSILVDISDFEQAGTRYKRRARRVDVRLPDTPGTPCHLLVEVIPYELLPDGSYGQELTSGNFHRTTPPALVVDNNRLVEVATGRILASRYGPGKVLRPDAAWQADVARLQADNAVQAMYQADWFGALMENGNDGQPINTFIRHYIQLADLAGDLD